MNAELEKLRQFFDAAGVVVSEVVRAAHAEGSRSYPEIKQLVDGGKKRLVLLIELAPDPDMQICLIDVAPICPADDVIAILPWSAPSPLQ